jgi:hypothetical protein
MRTGTRGTRRVETISRTDLVSPKTRRPLQRCTGCTRRNFGRLQCGGILLAAWWWRQRRVLVLTRLKRSGGVRRRHLLLSCLSAWPPAPPAPARLQQTLPFARPLRVGVQAGVRDVVGLHSRRLHLLVHLPHGLPFPSKRSALRVGVQAGVRDVVGLHSRRLHLLVHLPHGLPFPSKRSALRVGVQAGVRDVVGLHSRRLQAGVRSGCGM